MEILVYYIHSDYRVQKHTKQKMEKKEKDEILLHYVSRLLLKNFLPDNKDKLYVLEKPDIEKLKGVKDAASELDYNVLIVDGKKNYDVEMMLGGIETHIGRILKKINENNFNLSQIEWEHLLSYAATIFCNSPNMRDKILRFNTQILDHISEIKSNSRNKVHVDVNIFNEFDTSKNNLIYKGISQIIPTYQILSKMFWAFYVLKDESVFITSDIPIIPLNENQNLYYNLGFEYSSIVQFPLTKKVCLVGNWKAPDSNKECTGFYANAINGLMLRWSFKYVFSPLSFEQLNDQYKKFG